MRIKLINQKFGTFFLEKITFAIISIMVTLFMNKQLNSIKVTINLK